MSKSIAPAPLTDKSMATDIRNALREKKPGERGAFLVGDNVGDDVIAAVAHGPTFLSGLADEVRDAHVKAWSARKYPVRPLASRGLVRRSMTLAPSP